MHADGHLTKLDTAFSRDREHEYYVQDLILEILPKSDHGCRTGPVSMSLGEAARMAKDVRGAICRVAEEQGTMSAQAEEEYVAGLKESHRYHHDVY